MLGGIWVSAGMFGWGVNRGQRLRPFAGGKLFFPVVGLWLWSFIFVAVGIGFFAGSATFVGLAGPHKIRPRIRPKNVFCFCFYPF